ncbi:winged helix-turn-helix transcriptional regulator [Aeromicrobium terrae]|uniref:winged helix-turn-helix transcriptional regulator n=1 Tax=Aeromicrobium terrae TaxID=2498846 RepID=UPI001650C74E|nr:helix-turn-helix domain-containing protein [Aeromicrobium terrae]
MKSYDQYCAVARALDAAGDRWTLLIVRELLAFGPSRYSELHRGLPGMASNLLADRLRAMEADGLVVRSDGDYALTDRGRALEDVLRTLARWGAATMSAGPSENEAVQPQWSALFAGLTLADAAEDELSIGIRTGEQAVQVRLSPDGYAISREAGDADVMLSGSPLLVGGVLSGALSPAEAADLGLDVAGHSDRLATLVAGAHA